jgi:hypothetical protein
MLFSGVTRYVDPYPRIVSSILISIVQVEYLVVTYSEDDPRVLLSLRQADILTALANDASLSAKGGCVPELQDVQGSK